MDVVNSYVELIWEFLKELMIESSWWHNLEISKVKNRMLWSLSLKRVLICKIFILKLVLNSQTESMKSILNLIFIYMFL